MVPRLRQVIAVADPECGCGLQPVARVEHGGRAPPGASARRMSYRECGSLREVSGPRNHPEPRSPQGDRGFSVSVRRGTVYAGARRLVHTGRREG
jgi:hypothetical protein